MGGGKNLIEVDEIFIRHGRLSERPTYPELEALTVEGYRARQKAKRAKPPEPSQDDYTYMSDKGRLQKMKEDLLQELHTVGLKPLLPARKRDISRWGLPLLDYHVFLASNVQLAQITQDKTKGLVIFYVFPNNFRREEGRWIHEEDIVPVARKRDTDKYGQARRQLTGHSFRLVVVLVYGTIYKSGFVGSSYHEVIPLPKDII
ncbi:MAG: hypothetical protein WBH57_13685 [Anaerolineae bacterium]